MAKRLVYSTDQGRLCPTCTKVIDDCICKAKETISESDGFVRLSIETKGRKGKGVTLVTGLGLAGSELKKLAKQLKAKASSGGTIVDGVIELQGDHREMLRIELAKHKFKVKG